MPLSERPIIILGMQRSGTSAVSCAMVKLGAFMGADEDFFPPDANNSAGYFESRTLTQFNHKCLAFFQMHAASVWPLPSNWRSYPQAEILKAELKGLLLSAFEGKSIWGFKQPLASLLIPLYADVFDELGLSPQFVACVRNPIEIQASEAQWQYSAAGRQMAPLGSLAIGAWLRYTLGSLTAALGRPLTIVSYDAFLKNPRAILLDIVSKHGAWSPSEEAWTAAVASIRPNLRRQSASDGDLAGFPNLVRTTFELCMSGRCDEGSLTALVDEFERWLDILEPPPLSGTKMGFAWSQAGQIQSVQLPMLPTGDWQAMRFPIPAKPRTQLHGLFYNRPCRVWIRRCVFEHGMGESQALVLPGPGSHLSRINGLRRLEGAYEARQVSLTTPAEAGPYVLEIEFLIESGPQIVNDSATRIASRLHECAARKLSVERQISGGSARAK